MTPNEILVPRLPTELLRRHACHEPTDTRYRAAARLAQALWRERRGLCPPPAPRRRNGPLPYPDGDRWVCTATDWADGDTLTAKCDGHAGTVAVRLRGVDTNERGEVRWEQAREELRRQTAGHALTVLPRHHSHRRVVADVLAGGANVGAAMDGSGWSKRDCPKR